MKKSAMDVWNTDEIVSFMSGMSVFEVEEVAFGCDACFPCHDGRIQEIKDFRAD